MWLQTMWMQATPTSPFPLGVAVEAVEITKLSVRPSSETSERTLAWVSGDETSCKLMAHGLNSHPYGLNLNSTLLRNPLYRNVIYFAGGLFFPHINFFNGLFMHVFSFAYVCMCFGVQETLSRHLVMARMRVLFPSRSLSRQPHQYRPICNQLSSPNMSLTQMMSSK